MSLLSIFGEEALCFFWTPKEKVRPARFRNPDPLDLTPDRGAISCRFFFEECFGSSCPSRFVDEGAVEALLCLDEVSVDVALVVLDAPLPLRWSQRLCMTYFYLSRTNDKSCSIPWRVTQEKTGNKGKKQLTCYRS